MGGSSSSSSGTESGIIAGELRDFARSRGFGTTLLSTASRPVAHSLDDREMLPSFSDYDDHGNSRHQP